MTIANKLTLALAVSLLFAPLAQSAAVITPADMPAYGKDKPLPAPKIARKTLPNGLEVWVVPRNGLPRVDFVLAIRNAGYAADDKAHPGFANLLAGLLNEGAGKYDSRAIAELAQGMGGSVAASATLDGILVSAHALTSHAAPMLNLMADVTRVPTFPAKEVALTKANALQSLKVAETQPRFRADRALSKAIYGSHPYGQVEPTVEAITSTTEELLRAEHVKRFRPERALLVITGRVTDAQAMQMAQKAFGSWRGQGSASTDTPAAPGAATPLRLVLQRNGSVQSVVRLGSPGIAATSPDQVPMRLASTILGGGFSSRVNLNLREEKGYTYGASAGARMYREGGSIIGGAEVRNDVTGASLKEFMAEYKRIGTELVTPADMEMNKRYVAGGYLISNQLQRSVAGTLASNWLVGLPPEFLGQFVPLIQKVTAEQVRDVSKKYFAPEAQSIVVVGDNAAIGEQLKAYGAFTVSDK
ncbi:M16 family metallopeptidase [Massilia sp. S19_KUP03_FR1]|uniref:M16 family metallopeptidase n=1 Tax=Massilia sp. S19_KUP03_FR1 TaxID=3025503 RepID=UPI002FCDBA31